MLPPVDGPQSTASSTDTSTPNRRPTLPVSTELEVGELDHVEQQLQRPGASEELPILNETDEGVLFITKDGFPQNVEPLPAPLDSRIEK